MNVFLDDVRSPPDNSWLLVKTVEDAKSLLLTGQVDMLSLDNDLGPGQPEGYTLVLWMAENNVWPKNKPTVHSMNLVRSQFMRDLIDRYFI